MQIGFLNLGLNSSPITRTKSILLMLPNKIVTREPFISDKSFLDKLFELLRVFHIKVMIPNDSQRKAKLALINLHSRGRENKGTT